MKKEFILLSLVVLLVSGCSDSKSAPSEESTTEGNQKEKFSGTFIDAAVSGLDYNCSSKLKGITTGKGAFVCQKDDSISFRIGDYILGTTAIKGVITPRDLGANETIAINIAQLLQTLDMNDNPADGIELNPSLVQNLEGSTILLDSKSFDVDMSALLGRTLVSDVKAKQHLDTSMGIDPTSKNHTPTANPGMSQTVNLGLVGLDGSGSVDIDKDTLTYKWSIKNRPLNSISELSNSNTVSPSFNADELGTYTIELIVNDGTVDSLPVAVNIMAITNNSTPVAKAGDDMNATYGSLVTLDGSLSIDPDGSLVSYEWLENGIALSTLSTFSTYNLSSGIHNITLKVTDDQNASSTDSLIVTVSSNTKRPILSTGVSVNHEPYDDGYYTKGVPRHYTRLTDVVTDLSTNLMWQDQNISTSLNLNEGASYCQGLELNSYTDWRLPTIQELLSLIDYSREYLLLDPIIKYNFYVSEGHYMSSTRYSATGPHGDSNWYINFYSGLKDIDSIKYKQVVRCVRNIEVNLENTPTYIRENGVVYDSSTAKSWQDDGDINSTSLTWLESLNYCHALQLNGKSDWRLPNMNELHSIVDYKNQNRGTVPQAIDPIFLTGRESKFWSSTTSADYDHNLSYTQDAMYINFKYGDDRSDGISKTFTARCIRDGK